MKCEFYFPEIDYEKTGENIRELCKQKGLTVNQMQELLYVGSNQAIYSWYNGRTLPEINRLYALASLLEVTMDELIVEVKNE